MNKLKAKLNEDDSIEYFVLGFYQNKDNETIAICCAKNQYGKYLSEEFEVRKLHFTNLE